MARIVSLIASATEIVCALGFEEELVGRSHECDYPHSITRLPMCTRPRLDVHASSGVIDGQVKALLTQGQPIYEVESELLERLAPTVIVTQSQCEVCAVSLRDVEQAVCSWKGARPSIVTLRPDALADIWEDIQRVANALEAPERGLQLVATLQTHMQAITDRARTRREGPRVACIEWADPLMAGGNWVPELVARAGGVDLFGTAGKHAPALTWDQLTAADPDVIILMPCGYDLTRTRQDLAVLGAQPAWGNLRAVASGRVYVTDGNQYFNRPGPRVAESLEILAEILHPELFEPKHEGEAWQRA